MKSLFWASLGAALLVAQPANAGSFLVEFGSGLGAPNGGGNLDTPKFRVVNTSGPSATEPYLLSLALQLDPLTTFTLDGISNFGKGSYSPGVDNQPSMTNPSVSLTPKLATLTWASNNFDPGAYLTFTANFGPGTTDFRDALFAGTNTLTGLFSDGSKAIVKFAGDPNSTATTFSFASTGVPEPATWAMMIIGFGMIGGAMRRRQNPSVRYNFA